MHFNSRREVIIATGACGRPINVCICICIIVAALRCKYAGASALLADSVKGGGLRRGGGGDLAGDNDEFAVLPGSGESTCYSVTLTNLPHLISENAISFGVARYIRIVYIRIVSPRIVIP